VGVFWRKQDARKGGFQQKPKKYSESERNVEKKEEFEKRETKIKGNEKKKAV
jgi:hypothetical protein